MDANMINSFLQSTLEIIREVAQLSYQVKKIYKKKDDTGRGDITGIIEMSGTGRGTLAISFDQKTILYIVSKILDMNPESIDEDIVVDTVGELANMITGRAVRLLAENGYDIDLSVPKVVYGPEHKVVHQSNGPKIAIPYTSKEGNFTVEFSFDEEMMRGRQPAETRPDGHDKNKIAQPKSPSAAPPDSDKEAAAVEELPEVTPDQALAAESKAPANWGMPDPD